MLLLSDLFGRHNVKNTIIKASPNSVQVNGAEVNPKYFWDIASDIFTYLPSPTKEQFLEELVSYFEA